MKQKGLFHIVQNYTRNAYLVQSMTRSEAVHVVDLEGDVSDPIICTCEAFIFGHVRPCTHIISVGLYV